MHVLASLKTHVMNCLLAASIATTSLVEIPSNVGSLSFKKARRLGIFFPNKLIGTVSMNTKVYFWYLWPMQVLPQNYNCYLLMVFFRISPNIPLCLSFSSLLHELSAAVVCTTMFKFCAMSLTELSAIVGKNESWSSKIHHPMFEDGMNDVWTSHTRDPVSVTLSRVMINQV